MEEQKLQAWMDAFCLPLQFVSWEPVSFCDVECITLFLCHPATLALIPLCLCLPTSTSS